MKTIKVKIKSSRERLVKQQSNQQNEFWNEIFNHFDNQTLLHSVLKQKSILFGLKNEDKFLQEYSNACEYPIVLVRLIPFKENNKIYFTNPHMICMGEFIEDAGLATHWVMISHVLNKQVPVRFQSNRPLLSCSTLFVKPYELIIEPLSLLQ